MDIQLTEFKRMTNNEQHIVLFNNLNDLKFCIEGYRFNQKVQYTWLGIITLAVFGAEAFKYLI